MNSPQNVTAQPELKIDEIALEIEELPAFELAGLQGCGDEHY
jgi:hypothetical protein